MIGNDIIDLQLARKESNWRRPRFLQKIFTEEEQHFIYTADDKDTSVWLLWSGKESVYKIIARLEKRRFFAPKKICSTQFSSPCPPSKGGQKDVNLPLWRGTKGEERNVGQIYFEEYTFSIQSVVTDTHIHTIAQLDNNNQSPITNFFYIEKNNYQTQHQTTRRHLLKNYGELTNLAANKLTIEKDKWNIPHLYHQNKKQSVVISMSHHGNYGGYALLTV